MIVTLLNLARPIELGPLCVLAIPHTGNSIDWVILANTFENSLEYRRQINCLERSAETVRLATQDRDLVERKLAVITEFLGNNNTSNILLVIESLEKSLLHQIQTFVLERAKFIAAAIPHEFFFQIWVL